MQCPICSQETTQHVDISKIVPALHGPFFDLCSYWHHSPGVCYVCIDALDMQMDPVFQRMVNGASSPQKDTQPYVFSLSKQEMPFWLHDDDNIRLWFRGELRKKVKTSAYTNNHLFWSIADDNMVLLDYGEIVYHT